MSDNLAKPVSGAVLARVLDVPSPGAAVFDFRAGDAIYSLILARSDEGVFAYENMCPHASYPLERPDGRVVVQAGRHLLCSAHAASFDLATGACTGGPAMGKALTRVGVIVAGDEIRMA